MKDNIITYTEIKVELKSELRDHLEAIASRDEISGTVEEEGLYCFYLPAEDKLAIEKISCRLKELGLDFSLKNIEPTNWNAKWEASFDPVYIQNTWQIIAPFHKIRKGYEHTITIEPKMAFGTGHHPTTKLVLEMMQCLDFRGKRVLDLGCGSGILSIAAEKLGAAEVTAIDHDPLSVENTMENTHLNNCSRIRSFQGDADYSEDQMFDIILANINRNVIVENLSNMVDSLYPKGDMILSGFLKKDREFVENSASNMRFSNILTDKSTDWICLHLIKVG
ncbi:MAG: 50S ribosomal protein L11 methyltransferase [Saprospirales bacterium]|nr:MAG: 50S ribosomal protein L11 methyltransferase [Saprospirales bacterium]